METYLAILSKTEGDLLIPSNTPRATIYALREGLRYAEKHKIEPYNTLKEKFVIREVRDGIEVRLRQQIDFGTPIQQLAKSQHLVVDTVTNLIEVIGAVIFHKAPHIEFPNAIINGDALGRLEKWVAANQYKITQHEPHLILEHIDAPQMDRLEPTEHGMV